MTVSEDLPSARMQNENGIQQTYQFFEMTGADTVSRIFEFYERDYLKDTAENKSIKYVFFHSSGYASPNYTFEYYIDYGVNYKKHLYY